MTAPICPACKTAARLTSGAEVYPLRQELAAKPIWKCMTCPDAHVGCHPGTTYPLGTPAGKELRIARMRLHQARLDPIWQNAWRHPAYAGDRSPAGRNLKGSGFRRRLDICKAARVRTYAFLANRLGIPASECHTGMFDTERCWAAWAILRDVTYDDVRTWAKAQQAGADEVAA